VYANSRNGLQLSHRVLAVSVVAGGGDGL